MKKSTIIVSSIALITVIVALIIVLARPFRISGNCMEPAIKDGHIYFLNHLTPYTNPLTMINA